MKYNRCGCGAKEGEYHRKTCEIVENLGYNFIHFSRPNICARCGKINPVMKMVDDNTWEYIIGHNYNFEDILCCECMNFILETRKRKEQPIYYRGNKYYPTREQAEEKREKYDRIYYVANLGYCIVRPRRRFRLF